MNFYNKVIWITGASSGIWKELSKQLAELGAKEISPLLKEKVEKGELGVKTGKGFYDWTPESIKNLKQKIGETLIKIA